MFYGFTKGPIYRGFATSDRSQNDSKMNFAMEPYLDIVVNAQHLQIDFHLVPGPAGVPGVAKKSFDSVRVNLATSTLV